jgi:hypothetical protein
MKGDLEDIFLLDSRFPCNLTLHHLRNICYAGLGVLIIYEL